MLHDSIVGLSDNFLASAAAVAGAQVGAQLAGGGLARPPLLVAPVNPNYGLYPPYGPAGYPALGYPGTNYGSGLYQGPVFVPAVFDRPQQYHHGLHRDRTTGT